MRFAAKIPTAPPSLKTTPRRRPLAQALAGIAVAFTAVGVSTPSHAWDLVVCADFNRLPFSFREETGYENRIAEIIADELGANLVYAWWPYRDVMVANAVRPGECDVVIGTAEGGGDLLTTFSYLRSPFVFVYREAEDYDIFTFDDPILRELRIGVQPRTGPTHQAILARGLSANIVETFEYVGGETNDPLAPAIWAVADGTIDVAVMWGPAAGYYAALSPVPLVVQPVPPFEPPFIPMYINISVGVRIGDDALRDEIDLALAARWEEINAVFEEFHIPTMDLPRPTPTLEAFP